METNIQPDGGPNTEVIDQIVEGLEKAGRVVDQIAIGKHRVASNLDLASAVMKAVRDANLGEDTNRVLDAAMPLVAKLRDLVA